MVELVVTADLKSAAERHPGSTPGTRTKFKGKTVMNQKERSLATGERIEIGNTVYVGRNPEYKMIGNMWVKVRKGIPFVKV